MTHKQTPRTLISGGGSGLGLAMAMHLAKCGHQIVIIGRRREVLEAAAKKVIEKNPDASCEWHACDIREHGAIQQTLNQIWASGPLTGLVNNAAANFLCPAEMLSPNGFHAIWSIVAAGTFFLTQAVGSHWIKEGMQGRICSISTTYASGAGTYMVPSAMAKSAVEAMTRTLAVEWASHGIGINAIAPGLFPTEGAFARLAPNMSESAMNQRLQDYIPMGRYGKKDELVHLVEFLLNQDMGYLTGQVIEIDGGLTLAGSAGPFYHEFKNFSQKDWLAFREVVKGRTDR